MVMLWAAVALAGVIAGSWLGCWLAGKSADIGRKSRRAEQTARMLMMDGELRGMKRRADAQERSLADEMERVDKLRQEVAALRAQIDAMAAQQRAEDERAERMARQWENFWGYTGEQTGKEG